MQTRSKHAKRYSVAPRRASGGKVYTATYRDARNERKNKSLKTDSLREAQQICDHLVDLHEGRPVEKPHPQAVKLYYGGAAISGDGALPKELPDANTPAEVRALQVECANLRQQNQILARQLAQVREELDAYLADERGKMIEAHRSAPALADCLHEFEAAMTPKGKVTSHARKTIREAQLLVESLPPTVDKPTQIEARHVEKHLLARINAADTSKSDTYYNALRTRAGRFVNWCARLYKFKSPMLEVARKDHEELAREKDRIAWYTEDQIEAAIKPLDAYWTALVAVYGYAGLRRSEALRLRREDLYQADNGEHYLRIRKSKTGAKRSVHVHPTLLLPRLQAHLAADYNDEACPFIFGYPPDMRARSKADGAESHQLHPDTLSQYLPKLLPDGWTCLNLRHSFGSQLLRKGKSYAEIAKIMGNSPEVARKHYADLDSEEVRVD